MVKKKKEKPQTIKGPDGVERDFTTSYLLNAGKMSKYFVDVVQLRVCVPEDQFAEALEDLPTKYLYSIGFAIQSVIPGSFTKDKPPYDPEIINNGKPAGERPAFEFPIGTKFRDSLGIELIVSDIQTHQVTGKSRKKLPELIFHIKYTNAAKDGFPVTETMLKNNLRFSWRRI